MSADVSPDVFSTVFIPSTSSFPRAILHIDGDSFFASCEQARNPSLKGKPVITGKERGIAASMSVEAKLRGVTRAMPLWEIKKICPDVICLPSDYEMYCLMSQHFYDIVSRYAGIVEEYGIDECFADLTGLEASAHKSYFEIAEELKVVLKKELGCTFSIGLAPNKVLAKLASKWKKPYGFTSIPQENILSFLKDLPVEVLWGIGRQTSAFLRTKEIFTADQFLNQNEWWVKQKLSRPFHDIWRELRGEMVIPFNFQEKQSYQSIQKFRTFTPPSDDSDFVFAQLSKNIENACIKLRRYHQATAVVHIILRTQDFRHTTLEIALERPTNLPPEILPTARKAFQKMFKKHLYRATGVVFSNLVPMVIQQDLFGRSQRVEKLQRLYESADKVAQKYGKHSLFLGTSWRAQQFKTHLNERGDEPERKNNLFLGETKRKRLGIPMLLGGVV